MEPSQTRSNKRPRSGFARSSQPGIVLPLRRPIASLHLHAVRSASGRRRFAGHQFGDADAKIVVQNQHFAAGDQAAIGVNVDRVAGQLVQAAPRPLCSSLSTSSKYICVRPSSMRRSRSTSRIKSSVAFSVEAAAPLNSASRNGTAPGGGSPDRTLNRGQRLLGLIEQEVDVALCDLAPLLCSTGRGRESPTESPN